MTPPPTLPERQRHGRLLPMTGLLLIMAIMVAGLLLGGGAPRPSTGMGEPGSQDGHGDRVPHEDTTQDRDTETEQVPLTIVVDPRNAHASDDNAGSAEQPLATLGQSLMLAAEQATAGRPVIVQVRPGVYRESLEFDGSELRAPVSIVGAGPDKTTVDGADEWTDWTSVDGSPLFAHPWPYKWGVADLPSDGWTSFFARNEVSDVARRREAVWVDGFVLRQVLTREESEATPATFHVDEDQELLFVHPPASTELTEATVEVAVRDRLLDVVEAHGFTLRGISFQRAATPLQEAAVRFRSSRDVVVEDARFAWNSWGALALQRSEDIAVRDSSLDHNGVMGLSVWRTADLELINVDNSYNNTWRGRWAGYFGWANGSKFYSVRRVLVEGWIAVGNDANGLWLDTDVADVTIRDSYIANNLRRGIFLEALQGPVVISGSVICGNRSGGVVDGKAIGVTLEDNIIVNNGDAQLRFSGTRGGRSFTTYDADEDLTILSEHWTMRNNVFAATDAARLVGNNLDKVEWERLRATLTSTGNDWYHPTKPRPFALPGRILSFSEWQRETGQERGSRFIAEARYAGCARYEQLGTPD